MLTFKNKIAKNLKLIIKIIITLGPNIKEKSSKINDQKIDKNKNQAKSLTKKLSKDFSFKSKDYIRDF